MKVPKGTREKEREREKKHRVQKSWAKSPGPQVPDSAETRNGQPNSAGHATLQGTGGALETTVGPDTQHQTGGGCCVIAVSTTSLSTTLNDANKKPFDGIKHFGPY